jgi:hypothetical protein
MGLFGGSVSIGVASSSHLGHRHLTDDRGGVRWDGSQDREPFVIGPLFDGYAWGIERRFAT